MVCGLSLMAVVAGFVSGLASLTIAGLTDWWQPSLESFLRVAGAAFAIVAAALVGSYLWSGVDDDH